MGITRKLEAVHQDLSQLAEQGKIVGFLTNAENVQRINSLVEDIHKAMADYQVCVKVSIFTLPNVCARFHCCKTPTTTLISSL